MKEQNQKTMAKATFGTIALATALIILFIANPILTICIGWFIILIAASIF